MSKKVALIGALGISNWASFETAAREIAPRLAERGYDEYCSCEKNSCETRSLPQVSVYRDYEAMFTREE